MFLDKKGSNFSAFGHYNSNWWSKQKSKHREKCMRLNNVHIKQSVALTERNRTGPAPCSVGHPTAHAPGGRLAARRHRYRQRQTTPTDYRRQRAKQYWPIRRASNNLSTPAVTIEIWMFALQFILCGVYYLLVLFLFIWICILLCCNRM